MTDRAQSEVTPWPVILGMLLGFAILLTAILGGAL